jgi:hypothetical protein
MVAQYAQGRVLSITAAFFCFTPATEWTPEGGKKGASPEIKLGVDASVLWIDETRVAHAASQGVLSRLPVGPLVPEGDHVEVATRGVLVC